MKKTLAILAVLFISAFSLIGCDYFTSKINYQNSELGLIFEYPNSWSIAYENNTSVEIQNNSDTAQSITINKFKSISDNKDILSWFEESGFPTPASEYEETTVDGLPALKTIKGNTVIVPDGNKYYMIQDCLSLSCKAVDEVAFLNVLDSIEFTN